MQKRGHPGKGPGLAPLIAGHGFRCYHQFLKLLHVVVGIAQHAVHVENWCKYGLHAVFFAIGEIGHSFVRQDREVAELYPVVLSVLYNRRDAIDEGFVCLAG